MFIVHPFPWNKISGGKNHVFIKFCIFIHWLCLIGKKIFMIEKQVLS